MLEGFDNFEMAAVVSVIRSDERVTGLTAEEIGHDSDGIRIQWAYEDGAWAGTSCYDLPLASTLEKLQRELETTGIEQAAA